MGKECTSCRHGVHFLMKLLLKNLKQGTGVGIDISEQALEVARRNAKRLGLEAATTFVLSDLFEKAQGPYDMIVSNPPYIETEEIAQLMPEVRDHEPRLALDGMSDGRRRDVL